jgi:hypothetical protein
MMNGKLRMVWKAVVVVYFNIIAPEFAFKLEGENGKSQLRFALRTSPIQTSWSTVVLEKLIVAQNSVL